jgi:hypothetical protein
MLSRRGKCKQTRETGPRVCEQKKGQGKKETGRKLQVAESERMRQREQSGREKPRYMRLCWDFGAERVQIHEQTTRVGAMQKERTELS